MSNIHNGKNMWHLTIDEHKADAYARDFWKYTNCRFYGNTTHLKKYVPRRLQTTRAYSYLTKNVFMQYLSAQPMQLLSLHNALFTHILSVPGKMFEQKEWYEYIKDNTKHSEYGAITSDEIDCIKSIFNYNSYVAQNTEFSYHIAKLLNVNTCTYCNRQYTLTVVARNHAKIIRPEFDHWFAQSLYPDLALSFFNLIPTCALCNSVLKNDKETELDTHIHPYIDNDAGFNFSYRHLKDGNYAVSCYITRKEAFDRRRVKNTLELFRIQEVYNAHAEHELKDLIDLASVNPGDYIKDLVQHVLNKTTLTEEEIYRMLFGVEIHPERYLIRPMSKFKKDIMEKIHEYVIGKS